MKNTNVALVKALRDLAASMADILSDEGIIDVPNVVAKNKRVSTKAAAAEEDEDEEAEEEEAESKFTRKELSSKTLAALKKIAIAEGFDADDLVDATKDDIIDSLLEEEEEEEEAEAEEEPEGDEDEEGYSRDELEEMSLGEVKALAKENGYSVADLRGKDKDAIIDLMLGEAEEEEEEEEAEEDEEEEETITEDDLKAMGIGDLRELAKEYEIKLPAGSKKADIIAAIMEAGE